MRTALRPLRLRHALPLLLLAAACKSEEPNPLTPVDGGVSDAGPTPSPFADVPVTDTLTAAVLSAPVEVVRDDAGIPHMYGKTLPDIAYAQGYLMASDRWVQMDLGRRQASGTLAEVLGSVSAGLIDTDIAYRTHHMRKNAETTWANLQASTAASDQKLVKVLKNFAAGVNAWQAELAAGKKALPVQLALAYRAPAVKPWSEVDSLVLGELQAFSLAFDADGDIERSAMLAAEAKTFVGSADAAKAARVGFSADYSRFAPFDPTFTVDGWGQAKVAANAAKGKKKAGKSPYALPESVLALLRADEKQVRAVGLDRKGDPDRGSNNWVVGPSLSASGHAMVANDTHLSLGQPSVFWLNHFVATDDNVDAMGVQFAGIPLIILGMNKNMAWGSTVNYVDVTDVYAETVKDCAVGGGKCVVFKGGEVKLVERKETFNIGSPEAISATKEVTIYEVPQHGPIIVRSAGGVAEPLGAQELSMKYTGYEPAPLLSAIYGLVTAKTVDEGRAALDANFKYGGQNWVMADRSGDILWTQTIRIPKRPAGAKPWLVLPGDGSAEWLGYFDSTVAPAAKNPAKGYLVTANADPLGTTADNDPANEPVVDGSPTYLGSEYDPGTRIGRITKRIQAGTKDGKKLTLDDMQSIQADAVTEWGQALAPTFLEGVNALLEEITTPGTHPELATMLGTATPEARAALTPLRDAVKQWTFDTPAGNNGETAQQLADSRATLAMALYTTRLAKFTIGDETAALGVPYGGSQVLKLLGTLVTAPNTLATKEALWDDLTTPNRAETRLEIAAKAVLDAAGFVTKTATLGTDPNNWRWGKLHTVSSTFPFPVGLDMPAVARHGGDGTVDVGNHGLVDDLYTYSSGAAIRFVAEIDPDKGPIARNVIPGGQVFYKESPHFQDLFDLWAQNKTTDLAFEPATILPRAQAEYTKNKNGRVVFNPK